MFAHIVGNIANFYVLNLQLNRMSSFGFMAKTNFQVKNGVSIG